MPSLVNIHDQKYDNSKPLKFTCRLFNNKSKIAELNKMILLADWTTLHQSDVNIAFKEFQDKIESCLDTVAPLKHVVIPKYKIWREPWITKASQTQWINVYISTKSP